MLGKYVPYLTFLDVLLSDEPVTELNRYYQRLVARDQDGAVEIVEELLETQTLLEVYEDVLIPALYYTQQDQRRGNLTDEEAHAIYQAMHELIDNLSASQDAPSADAVASRPRGRHRDGPPTCKSTSSGAQPMTRPMSWRSRCCNTCSILGGLRSR